MKDLKKAQEKLSKACDLIQEAEQIIHKNSGGTKNEPLEEAKQECKDAHAGLDNACDILSELRGL